MVNTKPILIHEFQTLIVGENYYVDKDQERTFEEHHFVALAKYLTVNKIPFYTLGHNRIYFKQFVGVIKVGNLTIEVLPKTDKHELGKSEWQKVLLEMLLISLQVEAKATTHADITVRQHTVLDTYLQLLLDEAEQLIHKGLVKKYRTHVSNQTALKGKLLVHKQITHNAVHAERFYVSHQVYDQDNVYNYILRAALECIASIGSTGVSRDAQALLLFFPECKRVAINEKLFAKMSYDRKTESYRRSIELARIILLNYHPDLKGGQNDILAIMFDMNFLWESFITWSLKRAAIGYDISVLSQSSRPFWKPDEGNNRILQPDILLDGKEMIVIDTKWKFESKVSLEDLRQIYAYLHYFEGTKGFLLYPDRILEEENVCIQSGNYSPIKKDIKSGFVCGLMFADLIIDGRLNRGIGGDILTAIGIKN